ncbi:MAG: FAD-dependent monooxygenase [Vicinamibacterales bacterium]
MSAPQAERGGAPRNYDADVVVAGAGPAGSVAAASLAARGLRVVLCDRYAFPRDKTCGDALIADALMVLERIGLAARVAARAQTSRALDIISPRGGTVSITGLLRVLPRRELDQMLLEHALNQGAEFRQLTVESPLIEDGRVAGVSAKDPSGRVHALRAPLTVLATGAGGGVLRAFDPQARSEASGTALRAYARPSPAKAGAAGPACVIALDQALRPGYAWAFPAPGGMFNVGVGLFRGSGLRAAGVNLRASLDALLAGEGAIGRRFGPFTGVTPMAGAPLRTSLTGTASRQPGLAIVGEAAGTTYAATGEGIGKAMESSLLLDELAAATGGADLPALGLTYGDVVRARFHRRFHAYDVAERWVSFPPFVDYVVARAGQSPYIRHRLSEFLSETDLPTRVFSVRGIWRLMTAR